MRYHLVEKSFVLLVLLDACTDAMRMRMRISNIHWVAQHFLAASQYVCKPPEVTPGRAALGSLFFSHSLHQNRDFCILSCRRARVYHACAYHHSLKGLITCSQA